MDSYSGKEKSSGNSEKSNYSTVLKLCSPNGIKQSMHGSEIFISMIINTQGQLYINIHQILHKCHDDDIGSNQNLQRGEQVTGYYQVRLHQTMTESSTLGKESFL